MPDQQTAYLRAAHTFRAVLDGLDAAALLRPVPSCPGWTVSDVVTHVLDDHADALGPERADEPDLLAAYAVAIPTDPAIARSAGFDTLDLTVHAWDIALALGADLRLGEDQLTFLEVFAREAGDRLYVAEGFDRPDPELLASDDLDRQARALLPFGRRPPG